MVKTLLNKNPGMPVFCVTDAEFAPYGKIRTDIETAELIAEAKKLSMPEEGSAYTPSEPTLEAVPVSAYVAKNIFGGLATQMGYCRGHNSELNALEWHIGSELNIAVTPMVLLLALPVDRVEGVVDSASVKAFYVPQGTAIELYEGVMHFCPCQVEKTGFGCIVGLLQGTNLPMESKAADPVLFKTNKWLIAHSENRDLIDKGIVAGICGENLHLNY